MERYSDKAIEILNELHTERLDYHSEYLPLIDAVQRLAAYENTGMEPEEVLSAIDMAKVACALHELNQYKELGSVERLRNAVENQSAFEEFMEHWKEAVAIAGSIKEVGAERVAELVQADKDGRCIVFSEGFGVVKSYNPNEIEGAYVLDACGVISKEEYEYQTGLKGEQP